MTAATYLAPEDFAWEVGTGDTLDNARFQVWLDRASRVIDRVCGLPAGAFAAQTATKTFDWYGHKRLPLDGGGAELVVPPLLSVTTLKTDEDDDGVYEVTWTAGTDYVLWPANETPVRAIRVHQTRGRYSFPPGQATIQIVGSWGWSAEPPDDIKQATFLVANRYRQRRNTPEGMMGNADVGFAKVDQIDPDVRAILELGGYIQRAVFA